MQPWKHKKLILELCNTLQYVVLYFSCSIGLTLFVRFTMQQKETHFPLTNLCVQMTINFFVSGLLCKYFGLFVENKILNWNVVKPLIRIGVLTGLDYGLSNTSFLFTSVTFYVMLKSGVPLVVMLISFMLCLMRPKLILVVSVLLLSVGISAAMAGSLVSFDWRGFFCIVAATILAGVRLVFLQQVLQNDTPTADVLKNINFDSDDSETSEDEEEPEQLPKNTQYPSLLVFFYICPIIAITLCPFAVVLESIRIWNDMREVGFFRFVAVFSATQLFGSFIGLILNVSEYLSIQKTSSLTLTTLGVLKELLLIACSVLLFGDKLTVINVTGYFVCVIGMILYKYDRFKELQQRVNEEAEFMKIELDALDSSDDELTLDSTQNDTLRKKENAKTAIV